MRSFVIFALLALAFCQSPLDIITGLSTQLNLNDAQTTDLNNCFVGLVGQVQSLAPLYNDYLNQDVEAFVSNAESIYMSFEPALQAACGPVINDFMTYTVSMGNGNDTKINLEENSAYVAQQIAVLIQEIATQNFTGIGTTLGYIYQIAIGAVELPSLQPTNNFTQDQINTLIQNSQDFSNNTNGEMVTFFQAFIDELGLTNQINASALVQLVLDAKTVETIIETYQETIQTGDFNTDITALETLFNALLEVVRANEQGLEAIATIDGAIIRQFINNPVEYTARVIYNILLNAPKLEGFGAQAQQALLSGDFTSFGAQYADLEIAVYGDIFA